MYNRMFLYRVSYLRVCKMNQFRQKEGAWKKFILSLICDVYKCTFMDLYQFSSQFCPCSLYEPIFEKLHFHLKILFLEKPLYARQLRFWSFINTPVTKNLSKYQFQLKFSNFKIQLHCKNLMEIDILSELFADRVAK